MQTHADAFDPRLGRRLRQQAPVIQVDDLFINAAALLGVALLAGQLRQVVDLKHIHAAVQMGVPLVVAAAGHDAVLHLIQTLRVDHKAEAMQDGAQGHVRVGGPLPCPQGIGQYLVGDALPAPQNEILHQRRCLAGLRQLCQHGLAVHTDLKAAQHFDFNCCHPSHPLSYDAHDVPAFCPAHRYSCFKV